VKTALHKKKGRAGREGKKRRRAGRGGEKREGDRKGEGEWEGEGGRKGQRDREGEGGKGRGRQERVDQNRCGRHKKATHKKGSRLAWAGRHHLRCITAIISRSELKDVAALEPAVGGAPLRSFIWHDRGRLGHHSAGAELKGKRRLYEPRAGGGQRHAVVVGGATSSDAGTARHPEIDGRGGGGVPPSC